MAVLVYYNGFFPFLPISSQSLLGTPCEERASFVLLDEEASCCDTQGFVFLQLVISKRKADSYAVLDLKLILD